MLNFVMNLMCIFDRHKYDYCTTQFVNNFIFIFYPLIFIFFLHLFQIKRLYSFYKKKRFLEAWVGILLCSIDYRLVTVIGIILTTADKK